MAGSNTVAAKNAILAGLQGATGLVGVQVTYVWPGRTMERECLYGGKIHIEDQYLAFRSGLRVPRLETATIGWTVEVRHMDSDAAAGDARALALGAELENLLGADPTLAGVVKNASITSADLEDVLDDDALTSVLTYEINVRSQLD